MSTNATWIYRVVLCILFVFVSSAVFGLCSATALVFAVGVSSVSTVVLANSSFIVHRGSVLPSDVLWDLWKKIRLSWCVDVTPYADNAQCRTMQKDLTIAKKSIIPRTLAESHCGNGIDIDTCLHFILRDFVLSWYQSISCNNQFSKEVHYLLEDLSVALTSRIRKVNKYKLAKNIVTLYHCYFINYLRCLQAIQRTEGGTSLIKCLGKTENIESRFETFHVAMASEDSEVLYMSNVVNTLLEVLTPVDLLTCQLARKMVVDIVVKNVMLPLMDCLSDPDWTNGKIITILSKDSVNSKSQVCVSPAIDSVTELQILLESLSETNKVNCNHEDSDVLRQTVGVSQQEQQHHLESESSDMHSDIFHDVIDLSVVEVLPHTGSLVRNRSVPNKVAGSFCEASAMQQHPSSGPPSKRNSIHKDPSLGDDAGGSALSQNKLPSFLPTSRSLEHLSSVVMNTLGELERPIEYITGNLAQYFRVAGEDADNSAMQLKCSDSTEDASKRRGSSSWFRDAITIDNPGQALGQRRCSASDVFSKGHSISQALQGAMSTTTGLILSDRLRNLELPAAILEPSELPDGEKGALAAVANNKIILHNSSTDVSTKDSDRCSLPKFQLNLQSPAAPAGKAQDECDIFYPELGMPSPDDVDSVLEAVEMSPDNRCFMNLFIPSTEIMEEPGGGSHYALYCVEYEAWYLESICPDIGYSDSLLPSLAETRMILQGTQVKRRFREFLTLQDRLEANPSLRPFVQNIQKPSKWQTLPFSKTDRETVGDRRVFLENYLRKLVSKEEIAASEELREFLAYGSDASIAYVKKVPDSMVPRIDKFLARKVSGMFEKLRTALPTLPIEPPSPMDLVATTNKPTERRGFLGFQFGNHDDGQVINLQFGFIEREPGVLFVEDQLRRYISESQYGDSADALCKNSNTEGRVIKLSDLPSPLSPDATFPVEFGADDMALSSNSVALPQRLDQESVASSMQMQALNRDIPLASTVLNLAAEGIQDKSLLVTKDKFLCAMKLIFGKLLERWMCDKLDEYTTWEMCIKYLRQVRDAIWPGGVLPMEPDPSRTNQEKLARKELALRCLKDFMDDLFPFLDDEHYNECMELFFDSLQHPKLLRHLMYSILDLVVEALAREAQCPTFQEKFTHIM